MHWKHYTLADTSILLLNAHANAVTLIWRTQKEEMRMRKKTSKREEPTEN